MKKILVTASRYSELCSPAKKLLEENGFQIEENTTGKRYSATELMRLVPNYDAAIVGMDDWNAEVIKQAKKMKIITKFGVGYDNIDIDAARESHIMVTYARGQNAISVAELALSLLLTTMKNIPTFNNHVKKGIWDRDLQYELQGKTVGLYGFGNISQAFAKMLSGFDVQLIACDKFFNEEIAAKLNVKQVSAEYLLGNSDVLSLHVPGSKENTHMIGYQELQKMKKGNVLINTSRGNLIDLSALKDSLDNGDLLGAGLDCYEVEPVETPLPLFKHERVVCTPHCGGKTYEAYQRISMSTAENIIDAFNNKKPKNLL